MIATLLFGIAGSLITAFAVSVLAAKRDHGAWPAFGLAAALVYGVFYVGVLQSLVLLADPRPLPVTMINPEYLLLAYAGVGAATAFLITGGLALASMATLGRTAYKTSKSKAFLRAAILSLLVIAISAPILVNNQLTIERAFAANQAEIAALRTTYKAGLERLIKLGAVRKIEVGDDAITHYIDESLYGLGDKWLADYAKSSMIYHVYVAGREPKPIVLRNASTTQRIGVYGTEGVYVIDSAYQTPQKANVRR